MAISDEANAVITGFVAKLLKPPADGAASDGMPHDEGAGIPQLGVEGAVGIASEVGPEPKPNCDALGVGIGITPG